MVPIPGVDPGKIFVDKCVSKNILCQGGLSIAQLFQPHDTRAIDGLQNIHRQMSPATFWLAMAISLGLMIFLFFRSRSIYNPGTRRTTEYIKKLERKNQSLTRENQTLSRYAQKLQDASNEAHATARSLESEKRALQEQIGTAQAADTSEEFVRLGH